MLGATIAVAFGVRPTTSTTHSLNPRNPCRSFGPRLSLSPGKSVPRFWQRRDTMFEHINIQAGDGDGSAGVLQPEAFVQGSSSVAASGLDAVLNNLSKWLVTAGFVVILLVRHDAEALWAAMGCVLNVVISNILKKCLNQERPVAHLRPDPGMPSSHAQSIFYFVIFSVLSLVQWLGLNGLTTAMSGLIVAVGSYFTWLRVSQQLHTVSQVVVGAVLGTIFSILWFWSWDSIVLKAFVSHLWVRLLVIVGAAGFSGAFALYFIRYLVMEEVSLCESRKSQS